MKGRLLFVLIVISAFAWSKNKSNKEEFSARKVTDDSKTSSAVLLPPCSGITISAYPYLETFDSGLGDWTQGINDDGDWTLDSGGTPSGSTGPSDDITGNGNYLYTEASSTIFGGLGSNATVLLESACFDLNTISAPFFSFYNHMNGANIGALALEISLDDGVTWTTLFSQSGNQGNQWNFVEIDLSTYVNQIVKFRFTGVTGNGFRSDIAIDHISIAPPTYCESNASISDEEWISNVTFASINNDSGSAITTSGYSDFTNISTDLSLGTSYSISIAPVWLDTVYDEGYAIWIDFNQDGDFEDAGEEVFTQAPTQSSLITGDIFIPLDALFGATRMRISMRYNGTPTPCEIFDFGEIEDYTVNISFDGLIFANDNWLPSAPNATTGTDNALVLEGFTTINSDVELNNLLIRSGAEMEISAGSSLTLYGDIISNGTLSLGSQSNSYSSLIVDGNVSGIVRYFRHTNVTAAPGENDANDLIAPPLSGQPFTDFIAINDNIVSNSAQTLFLFGPFEKPANNYVLYSNTESATLDAGKGYRSASTNNSTFEFVGDVNTGNINVPIEVSGATFPEWNLVGNPYPSYISLSSFLAANSSQLANPSIGIYGYDGNASDGWTIWNQAYSDFNPNAKITPGQGFLLASIDGGANIAFTPDMRTTGNSDDFILGRNSTPISYFKLNLTNNDETYHTEFYVTDNASIGLDPGYDARTFGGSAPAFSIYSHLIEAEDETDMAVHAISNSDVANDVIIPLGINAGSGQQITVDLSDNTLPEDIEIYLEDRLNNTFTLLNASDFVLTPSATLNGTGRFYLRFSEGTLGETDELFNTVEIFSSHVTKTITVRGRLQMDSDLKVYDVQGRLVKRTKLMANENLHNIDVSNLTSGVYVVTIDNNMQHKSKKLILK